MIHLAKLLVLIFALSITNGLLRAQDTTCDSGDILWVKETVVADTGHTSGTTGAEYNNFATPFGIQRAFDQACAGAIIRIVHGDDNYGPASTSWTGRDASTMQINVDTVDADASSATYIRVDGWVDETTACGTVGNRWTASCPVVLDFDRDGTTGADGFNFGALGDGYIFSWIGAINVDLDAFDMTNGANNAFAFISAENVTGFGVRNINDAGQYVVFSFFRNVGTGGSAAAINLNAAQRVVGNVIHCSTTSPASGQNGITGTTNASNVAIVGNVIRNCNVGVLMDNNDNLLLSRNTFRVASGNCVTLSGSSPDLFIAVGNVFEGCVADALELDPDAARIQSIIAYNVYDAVTQLDIHVDSLLKLDVDDARNGNGADFTSLGCAFAGATDETLNSDCAIPLTPPGAQLGSQGGLTPGAVYEAGGGGVSIMLQGVR